MTMSVGLGRIVADPQAPVLTRKALGVLSEPGLLVYDDALTIDETGRLVLRAKEGGGIAVSDEGIYLTAVYGIDSHVDIGQYDREWNAFITGTAPNHIEGPLAIGCTDFAGRTPGTVALGYTIEDAYVCIEAQQTQVRVRWDVENYLALRVQSNGYAELYSLGVYPTLHLITTQGVLDDVNNTFGGLRLNYGTIVEQFYSSSLNVAWAGGGVAGSTSWVEFTWLASTFAPFEWSGVEHISITPHTTFGAIPAMWISWSAYIDQPTGNVVLRLAWFDVAPADNRNWTLSIIRYKT